MSREDWLDLGLAVLSEEGPSGLTVARLCERAGRTRGSLYHHFADHDGLLRGVLERWRERYTEAVIAAASTQAELNDLSLNLDFGIEQGVRRLVARNEGLRPLVTEADERRIAYIAAARRAQGIAAPEDIAEIEYAAYLGFQQLNPSKRRLQALSLRFEALVSRG